MFEAVWIKAFFQLESTRLRAPVLRDREKGRKEGRKEERRIGRRDFLFPP
jgi:hypothetical protein